MSSTYRMINEKLSHTSMCGSELNHSICVCQPHSHNADWVQSLKCAHNVHRAMLPLIICASETSFHHCLTSASLKLGHVSPKSAMYLFSLVSLVSHWLWIQEWWWLPLSQSSPFWEPRKGTFSSDTQVLCGWGMRDEGLNSLIRKMDAHLGTSIFQ